MNLVTIPSSTILLCMTFTLEAFSAVLCNGWEIEAASISTLFPAHVYGGIMCIYRVIICHANS